MKFQELTEKEYREYWMNHPLKSFISSPELGKLREKNNWEITYVGVKEKKEILAATMLLSKKKSFRRKFASPRGPLLDFSKKDIVDFFINELKQYIKDKKGYVFLVDPYIVENNEVEEALQSRGFKRTNKKRIHMTTIDLNKTEEELWDSLPLYTRGNIEKAKNDIIVEELSENNLDIFYKIMKETSKVPIKEEYYQNLYKLFHDTNEIKFFITKKDDKVLSGAMFLLIEPEIVYLSGGCYKEYRNLHSLEYLQWELMKYGKENGFKKHNFYKSKAFIKSFNGIEEELIGEFELPISWHYYLFKWILKK